MGQFRLVDGVGGDTPLIEVEGNGLLAVGGDADFARLDEEIGVSGGAGGDDQTLQAQRVGRVGDLVDRGSPDAQVVGGAAGPFLECVREDELTHERVLGQQAGMHDANAPDPEQGNAVGMDIFVHGYSFCCDI